MILKQIPEKLKQAHRPGNDSSILNRHSSKRSRAKLPSLSNLNFQIETRSNELDQPQGMSAKMVANGMKWLRFHRFKFKNQNFVRILLEFKKFR